MTTANQQAVIDAAQKWSCDRMPSDWAEAHLAKALMTLNGDWPGCVGCDFECGESCTPMTVSQYHTAIDCHMAQLVRDGKLGSYQGYELPAMLPILVTAHGLQLHMMAASTTDAILRAQALYPTRHGFSARVVRLTAAELLLTSQGKTA